MIGSAAVSTSAWDADRAGRQCHAGYRQPLAAIAAMSQKLYAAVRAPSNVTP